MCDDVDEGPPKTRDDVSWIEKMKEKIHNPEHWEESVNYDQDYNNSNSIVSRFSFK